jgi:toxin ParE1/3/4
LSRYLLTPRAVADIDDIAVYTVEVWGEQQAVKYIRALQERFAWLATNPMLGRSRDEVGPGFRSYLQGSHVIFYEITEGAIAIIGIPHASTDFDIHFSG